MIFQKIRSSSKGPVNSTQEDPQRKKSLLPASRTSRYLNDVTDEKKDDPHHSQQDPLPLERRAPEIPVASTSFRVTEAPAGPNKHSNFIQSGRTNPGPVDLDESIVSEDSSYRKGEDSPVESMKEIIPDLLGLGSSSNVVNRESSSGNDEGEEHDCLLFEDEDEDRGPEDLGMLPSELPATLLPSVLFVPPRLQLDTTGVSVHANSSTADEPDYESVQRTRSGAKPPAEIKIDLDAVPPSPMRDYGDAYTPVRGALPMMLAPNSTDSPPAEVEIKYSADLGLRTKLCDAERLVRIILGKTNPSEASHNQYAILEHGSILQAIRSFAMMKAELIDLRKQQETNDSDPPAILTNLTSPASTRNTSSFSTPSQSVSPKTVEQPTGSSSLSPDALSGESPDWQRQLKTTRNALVMAARKCQSLEQQLKQANETIETLQLEQNPEHSTTIQSLEERLKTLEAENRQLLDAQALDAASSANIPAEIEVILNKLHRVPTSAVSHDERQKIRKYVLDRIDSTKDKNLEIALNQSQERESDARRSLQMAQDRINALEAQLNRFTANQENDDEVVPDPLEEALRQLERKNERISQLEESQVRLQSILQLTAAKCQPLQETASSKAQSTSERLRLLQAEHQALAESVRALEGQVIDL